MYLPPRITLRGVGVVNRRGSVPCRCSSMMLRAGVEAPKSMKKIIMPTSTWLATLGSLRVCGARRRGTGLEDDRGFGLGRLGEGRGGFRGHVGKRGGVGDPGGGGQLGGGQGCRSGAVHGLDHRLHHRGGDRWSDGQGRVLVDLHLGGSRCAPWPEAPWPGAAPASGPRKARPG